MQIPSSKKFTVIYSFKVHDGKEDDFIGSWLKLTELIYKYENSYGSRLHKANDHLFIAYAQWPDRETFIYSGKKLPDVAARYRQQMRESCLEIKTEYELYVIEDLLRIKQHNT